MIRVEITNEMLEAAEEGLYNMELHAKTMFDELFPNLEFEKDFLDNENFTDIYYLFEVVEKAVDERGLGHRNALCKLLEWTLQGLRDKDIREDHIKTIRNFDEKEIEEFISWLQESGLSYEEAQDPEIQIESVECFLNERR